ncbi:MAG: hypothetical protein IKE38_00755 [Erysipelotrichaceae bacterium]|nr:hypothetical protein [Erysipelotrichaceae bacterium]
MKQRETAFEIIYRTMADSSYSNLLMRSRLEELEPVKRPFVTNLVNGVLKDFDLFVYQYKDDIRKDTSLKNRIILAMAFYEKTVLGKEAAIVNNEYVELVKGKYDRAFINAVLRKERTLKEAPEAFINESMPEWIYSLLNRQYTEEELIKILKNYKRRPEVVYRINHKKAELRDIEEIEILDGDCFISKKKLVRKDLLDEGKAYIQDFNSAALYRHLDLEEDDVLLDVCSAPGSKFFNCLDIVRPENAYANDIHEHRVKLIKDTAELLGFEGIHVSCMDGRMLKDIYDTVFTKIILDVPCSGLGTLGRRPDLKYHIRPEDLDELEQIQYELLKENSKLLKKDGIILYSTCTLNKKENRRQIDRFLRENDGFILLEDDTVINDLGDCFYYAKLRRII